ncbi:hypothetical protein AUQ37_07775 [Candidatus Methanomethylophilus sp. 1R26]|uniref:response regulator n=1 Tax=Candidatus Methanomethylophilus sp. 1R26 TaxID=1769296 RepID=UPI000735E8BA|nr:response regulator [Candidatus Methanomethylophilus sp. 1R26]KUE73777.1 hypothetical protein AUQ37_07775 [Candidatus Methanomethylophilus sp. 1R26]
MKTLIVEDRDFMTAALTGELDSLGRQYTVVASVQEALAAVRAEKERMLVVLDNGVSGGGTEFINGLETIYGTYPGRKDRRMRSSQGPVVIFLRLPGESVPGSNYVKKVLDKPFGSEDFAKALEEAEFGGSSNVSASKKERMQDPVSDLTRRGIVPGEAYVVFEKQPSVVYDVMRTFSAAGYDMFIITAGRAKAVRDSFGLDSASPVFTLRGERYPLGTLIASAREFLKTGYMPVIAIDDLDGIIERCGIDSTMVAVKELIGLRKIKKYTLLASADSDLLSPNERALLTSMMAPYKED